MQYCTIDHLNWKAFNACLSNYGLLTWDVTPRSNKLTFLDLDITLENHKFSTRMYYKPRNLYLYLPPRLCHPPGVIKGMIFGQIKIIYDLTTKREDILTSILHFYDALRNRGHSSNSVRPYIKNACEKYSCPQKNVIQNLEEKRMYLHLRYNPNNPSRDVIQTLFSTLILEPEKETPLAEMRNRKGYQTGINRLIVCYHRHWNIRNYLFPRTLYKQINGKVSKVLAKNNAT